MTEELFDDRTNIQRVLAARDAVDVQGEAQEAPIMPATNADEQGSVNEGSVTCSG